MSIKDTNKPNPDRAKRLNEEIARLFPDAIGNTILSYANAMRII